jgi:hypothetical protein
MCRDLCTAGRSQGSFDHVRHWFGEVTKYATKNTSKLLIGNKIDMVDNIRVSDAEGKVHTPWQLQPVYRHRRELVVTGSWCRAAACAVVFAGSGFGAVDAVFADQCKDVGERRDGIYYSSSVPHRFLVRIPG